MYHLKVEIDFFGTHPYGSHRDILVISDEAGGLLTAVCVVETPEMHFKKT